MGEFLFGLFLIVCVIFVMWFFYGLGEKLFGAEITKNIVFALMVVVGIYKCIDKRTHNNAKNPKTKIIKKLRKKEINQLRVADSLKKEWKIIPPKKK